MITKKSYAIGLAILMLTSSTLAADRTRFFFKASAGGNKMKDAKEHQNYASSNKSKSKISPVFNIAAGGYFNNFARYELSFGYQTIDFKNSTVKSKIMVEPYMINPDFQVKRKSSVYSLMLNSYIDLPVSDNFNFFFGGGVGLAQIKEKATAKVIANNINIIASKEKSKNKRNFAYSLMTGVALKVSDNTNLELTYSWQDFGKTKYQNSERTKNRYNGHSVMSGIRFDI